MPESHLDRSIRLKAFQYVRALMRHNTNITAKQLREGFDFQGERIFLATRAGGIFKPSQMSTLLSIKTVMPRAGRQPWYDDQRYVREAFQQKDYFDYSFMKGGPGQARNRLLRQAYDEHIPIIYFIGVSPGRYLPLVPAFIYQWDEEHEKCQVGPGDLEGMRVDNMGIRPLQIAEKRQYYLLETRQRLHQSRFREAVLDAYGRRCAISNLPETRLIDAAHIVEDQNEELGQPVICNGLPLSKIHHAAFDNDLIGIDPEYHIHVSRRLLEQHDGPMLSLLQDIAGRQIRLPKRKEDYPDPERLEHRFRRFQEAA